MTTIRKFDGNQRISAWDQEHLAYYARQYGPALQRYFARRGAAPEICEDLTQDVFSRLSALARNESVENGEAYLMRTASSVWIDFLRNKQSKAGYLNVEYEDALHSPEGFSPERILEGQQALDAVVHALSALPDRTRQIYLLCRIDGVRRKDVAVKLKISVSAVDKHLMTAAKKVGLAVKNKG